jgi:predicted deacetylase
MMTAHLSLHDVAPETLQAVAGVLDHLAEWGCGSCMLLVIPGRNWQPADLDRLRYWQDQGHVLAGHGWHHRVDRYGGWRHRLHSWTLSRNVAEHLALDEPGIAELITRCAEWFPAHGFDVPPHYVPPAWAMGRIRRERLRVLPFATYETFRGVYVAEPDRFIRCPLVGFEADTCLRAAACRLFNRWNLSRHPGDGPLRISLHPHDLRLRLRGDLERVCREVPSVPAFRLPACLTGNP